MIRHNPIKAGNDMKRLSAIECLSVIIAETQKKALRQERERLECRHINRLERQRQQTIHTPEADLIRAAMRSEQ